MYRFSFGQKKISVRGISTIRVISQWVGITSGRSGIESGTSRSVSTTKQFRTLVIWQVSKTWLQNQALTRFISRHWNRLKAHIDFSASKHNYPAAYSVQRISWNYCAIFFIMTLTGIIKISYDWYQKPTSSGRYLNYFSQYSLCQKIGIIVSLIDRILLLSHPSFHAKNFDKIIRITRRILKTRSKHRNHINRKTKDQLS